MDLNFCDNTQRKSKTLETIYALINVIYSDIFNLIITYYVDSIIHFLISLQPAAWKATDLDHSTSLLSKENDLRKERRCIATVANNKC